jgi:hypothetical protein
LDTARVTIPNRNSGRPSAKDSTKFGAAPRELAQHRRLLAHPPTTSDAPRLFNRIHEVDHALDSVFNNAERTCAEALVHRFEFQLDRISGPQARRSIPLVRDFDTLTLIQLIEHKAVHTRKALDAGQQPTLAGARHADRRSNTSTTEVLLQETNMHRVPNVLDNLTAREGRIPMFDLR